MKEKFFLQTPLGLEFVTAKELSQQYPQQIFAGGIEISCSLAQGLFLNHHLRTTNRILLRFAAFKAKDFPSLFKRIQKLPWRQFIEKGEVHFHVSTHASRLQIKERIAEVCRDGYQAFHRGHQPKDTASEHPLDVFVRLENDIATLSVNTSGDALYRRGHKVHTVDAPLRENIAASLIYCMLDGVALMQPIHWVDPMAGSGTFVLEAAHFAKYIADRAFAYTDFPITKTVQSEIDELKREYSAAAEQSRSDNWSFAAYDVSDKAVNALVHNLKGIDAHIEQADLFLKTPTLKPNKKTFAIFNPPFGERLSIEGRPQDYFSKCLQACADKFAPTQIGVLMPAKAQNCKAPQKYKRSFSAPFKHGGLPVVFQIYKLATHDD